MRRMSKARFERQIELFGEAGQSKIASTNVAIIGLGGTGSHVAQQLAYLGVQRYSLVDRDKVETSNLNRLIGATPEDVAAARPKVEIAERVIRGVATDSTVTKVEASFITEEGFSAVRQADFVFGCVDRDAARMILNEVCQAYNRPYIDIATDIDRSDPRNFGGRLVFSGKGMEGCIYCRGVLDQDAIRMALSSEGQLQEDEAIYGVRRDALGRGGPSVVGLNGVLASLAVNEFMVARTGIRAPRMYLEYKGSFGIVSTSNDPVTAGCYACRGFRGKGAASVEHWIAEAWGDRL